MRWPGSNDVHGAARGRGGGGVSYSQFFLSNIGVQSQKAVSAYFTIEQILPFTLQSIDKVT